MSSGVGRRNGAARTNVASTSQWPVGGASAITRAWSATRAEYRGLESHSDEVLYVADQLYVGDDAVDLVRVGSVEVTAARWR